MNSSNHDHNQNHKNDLTPAKLVAIGSIFLAIILFINLNEVGVLSEKTELSDDESISAHVAAVGDVMAHGPQLESAHDTTSGKYNFEPVFEEVRPELQDADLAIANLETTLPGPEMGYTGYPLFAAPDSLVDALDYAGFDTIITANNHSLDTGVQGLERTVQVINNKGLVPVGTFNSDSKDRVVHKDINNMKLAMLSYTEMVNPVGTQPLTRDQMPPHVNLLSEEQITADMNEVRDDTDIVLAYVHWGEEYEDMPSQNQRHFAEFLANQGVDLVLGSHPHVIQPTEVIHTKGRDVFVAYSLGNFVSNQRVESLGHSFGPNEDGVILNLNLEKDLASGKTELKDVDFVPTWVYRYGSTENGLKYSVLPIDEALEKYNFQEEVVQRMENSKKETLRRLAPIDDLEETG